MRNEYQRFPATFIKWRFYFLVGFILLIVAGLVARLVELSIFKRDFLLNEGNARSLRVITTPALRGMITDRDGYPLAISTTVYSIWINPQEFIANSQNLTTLSELLNLKKTSVATQIQKYKNRHRFFMYVKRDVSPEIAARIKKLNLPGVFQQQQFKRFYPEGEVAAHVVGFTNVDDQGQEGIELAYNQLLAGIPGKKIVNKDRLGREIDEIQNIQDQKPGSNINLSINRKIQYLAYRELLEGIKKHEAVSGSVIVLDAKTGEILAMVNQPSFNPNNRVIKSTEALRNRALTDTFEPGSTIKAFSVATALDSGLYKPDTIIDTYPGWLNVGHHLVRDEHSKGPMTVTRILQISSNVGVTKMVLSLPPDRLWNLLHRVGFGEETGVFFPGEQTGSLVKREKWAPFTLATLAFGYGVSMTATQLAHVYAVIANDGVKIPLSLVKLDKAPAGKQVMEEKLAKQMRVLLGSVVAKGGSAQSAAIPGYHVCGKTGTAKIACPHGYLQHRYISSFVGMAPASHPRLVVAVVIHDPRGKKYYGGDVSAPVFKDVMEGALRILNVPPDDLESVENKTDKVIGAGA